jgi:hypothetical protein
VTYNEKHSSLPRYGINYGRTKLKLKFYRHFMNKLD